LRSTKAYYFNLQAVLYIFIKDPYYTLIESDEKMSTIFFVANAAGLGPIL
jgi:hypothetical protein